MREEAGMSLKAIMTDRVTLNRLIRVWERLIDWSLGSAARAGRFVADADAAIIGLHSSPRWRDTAPRRSFNQLRVMR